MALSLIIFDCDGVILESVDAKTQAYAQVAEEFGAEARDRLLEYHHTHGGVSRVEKFAWLYKEVLGREISKQESDRLCDLFAHRALQNVITSRLVPGVEQALRAFKGRVPMYVASGAPHEELVKILEERGLSPYFDGIYGSPPNKADLLRRILAETGLPASETVMVGDSGTDMYAAEAVHCLFYGRGEYFKPSGYPWHTDLTKLSEYLESLFNNEV